MKVWLVALIAASGIGVGHFARELAKDQAPGGEQANAPFAPTPAAAPIVALGYRELAADLLFVRLLGYFGGPDNEAHAMADLAEATAALDPQLRRQYEMEAIAITAAKRGVDNPARLRAIALLEQASREFPENWRYPNLAGQIYLADMATTDPAQRRAWNEKGAQLLETAMRKPNAPAEAAVSVSVIQSRLGQHQRAIDGLTEMLLVTNDRSAREGILAQIAALEHRDADAIAGELQDARRRFERAWQAERPALRPSLYLLVGPKLRPGFDLGELATGGRDVIGSEPIERLEPLTDPAPAP